MTCFMGESVNSPNWFIKGSSDTSWFLESFIVSASRSPPGQAPKRLDFWSSLSQSRGSLVSFLAYFSTIGSTLGALGAYLWSPKAVWVNTGASISATPRIPLLFGTDLGVICWAFLNLLGYVFRYRFVSSSRVQISWIWTIFWHPFLTFVHTCPHLWF